MAMIISVIVVALGGGLYHCLAYLSLCLPIAPIQFSFSLLDSALNMNKF